MNRFLHASAMGFALALTLFCISCGSGSSPAPSGGSGYSMSGGPSKAPVLMLCYTSPTAQKVILSAVFPVTVHTQEEMMEEPWAKDFRRFVGQSGSEGGVDVTCDQVATKSAGKDKADQLRKQGHEVVEGTYAYAGG